jgi:hypothetical protein
MKETLEMALEVLTNPSTTAVQHAVELIKKELAQPEQTKCPRCGEVNPAEIHTCSPQVAQPEQEPKPWVGLTVDEIMSCGWWDVGFAKAIEAKLKEKNHG